MLFLFSGKRARMEFYETEKCMLIASFTLGQFSSPAVSNVCYDGQQLKTVSFELYDPFVLVKNVDYFHTMSPLKDRIMKCPWRGKYFIYFFFNFYLPGHRRVICMLKIFLRIALYSPRPN